MGDIEGRRVVSGVTHVAMMRREGNGGDHACIESWQSLLKKELIDLDHWPTWVAVERAILESVEI